MDLSLNQSESFQGPSVWTPAEIPQRKEEGAHFQAKLGGFHGSSDASLFSSSLPVLFHTKLSLADKECSRKSIETASSHLRELDQDEGHLESLPAIESKAIGYLLPDDEEELLAGIMDDFDLSRLSSQIEEPEEYDLFSSGGGMELDSDSQESLNLNFNNANMSDYFPGCVISHHGISNSPGIVVGEHPYGEHPSRTLFVRNINSNVEDSELHALFEQYGAIRTLYTACKHRGFVMISYYDIRAARIAMRALQNKPLRRRKLDIHFSIPKDNPSDKDVNQGTLVVFNLDASVSNDDLRQIFGAYGEVKEIRETPHKRHHKFIEFYDVRAAEAALRALNRSDIAGKRIKLEPSRPGGARRSLMQHLSQESDPDENRTYPQQVGSPIMSSPPGPWEHFSSPSENGSRQAMNHSRGFGNLNPLVNKPLPAFGANLPPLRFHSDMGRANQIEPASSINSVGKLGQVHQSHPLSEHDSGIVQVTHYNSSGTVPVPQRSATFGLYEATGNTSSGSFGYPSSSSGGSCAVSGPQFLWGSPSPYSHHIPWPQPSLGYSFNANGCSQPQGYSYSGRQGPCVSSAISSHHCHVGSAPSGEPSFERHLGYLSESPDLSFASPGSFGTIGISCANESCVLNIGLHGVPNAGAAAITTNGNIESGSPSFAVLPPQCKGRMFSGGGLTGSMTNYGEGLNDRGRNRHGDISATQTDNKKQYQLNLEKIMCGEDTRTTIMIKNIPNKYTSKMLLATIDEHHCGTYDFFYLPIDFKNKCNVGYAFINMTSPSHIIPLYQAMNGKKWEKFNSEKVASLAYARIQGKAALIAHFQNSSLMNEDKRCRPILFHPGGQGTGGQETFPLGVSPRENSGDGDLEKSPTRSANKDESVPGSVENTPSATDFFYEELTSEINKFLDLS